MPRKGLRDVGLYGSFIFIITDVVEVDDGWYYLLRRKAALLLLYPDRANIIRF